MKLAKKLKKILSSCNFHLIAKALKFLGLKYVNFQFGIFNWIFNFLKKKRKTITNISMCNIFPSDNHSSSEFFKILWFYVYIKIERNWKKGNGHSITRSKSSARSKRGRYYCGESSHLTLLLNFKKYIKSLVWFLWKSRLK